MSANNRSLNRLSDITPLRSIKRPQVVHPLAPITYPSSGAYQHLPIRTTIAGDPMLMHPNAKTIFLRNLPSHCYTLPSVTLNFTIVEILALLPNWFKNKSICTRFMNNNLTAQVHFMILEEHRDLKIANGHERKRARKTLTDEYRKTMRKATPGWTKAKHTTPFDWDSIFLSADGFIPDDVSFNGYRRPPSVPFRDLTIGVKKLPEGTNAGDLTHALKFALESPQDYMFPDDLSHILEHVGRIKVTIAHTDRPIIRRYIDHKRMEEGMKKPRLDQDVGEPFSRIQTHQVPHGPAGVPFQEGQTPAAQKYVLAPHAGVLPQQRSVYRFQALPLLPPQIMIPDPSKQAGHQLRSDVVEYSSEDMEALLGLHLAPESVQFSMPLSSMLCAPHYLLRDCIEGNVGFDGSALARAARFAQRLDQVDTDWYVEHVPWLVELFEAAQLEAEP